MSISAWEHAQTLLKFKNVFMQSPEEIRQAEVNKPHLFLLSF